MNRRSLQQLKRAIAERRLNRRVSHAEGAVQPAPGPAPADLPSRAPRLLDEVELREPFNEWPAGAVGDVVHVHGGNLLVEIADENGQCLDLFWSKPELLRPLGF